MMEGRNLEKSRRFFDLFLRLLSDGALDDASDRFASNGTFWMMLYGLSEKRPEWCAEVAAAWLDRQIAIVSASAGGIDESSPRLNDQFGVDQLLKSAHASPGAFLEFVLPAVVRAAATFLYSADEEEFSRDRLWPILFRSDYLGLTEAFLSACEDALQLLGQQSPTLLRPLIDQLSAHRLYTANHLLMKRGIEQSSDLC